MQPLQPHSSSTSRKIDFERTIRRTKKPPARRRGFVQLAKQILSADRYTGLQIRWTNNRQRRLGHDQFDPEGIPAPEIRRRVRLAQCVHAGLFRSGGCFGETRSSNMTHDPWSISARLRETCCLSVFTRISVPARTVLWLPVM